MKEQDQKTISEIEKKRHTLAHLLGAAILELYPGTKNTIGPAIDNGFYYDFDFGSQNVSEKDLPRIETKMKELLKTWTSVESREVSLEEFKKEFSHNEYKQELAEEITGRGEKLTIYTMGTFNDLCRGGHSDNASAEISPDSFCLSMVAGSYWRGDENKNQLTRIYGLAFNTKEELEAYKTLQEEAKKRDHKKLGKELDIFFFSELVGSGLPLWTPKGTLLRNLLDEFVWSLRKQYGYEKVEIPHITKKELYETSGHWDKFKDELFNITTREGHQFSMKPMNCPHHTQIYARRQWSYRNLPQRYANTTMCYRDEQSGELSGLSRVRSFTQDDAHVFCRQSQAKEEFVTVWKIIHTFYKAFGFELRVRLSLSDPEHPEKYLGDRARWEFAEEMLREIAKEQQTETFDGIGEAAFYGPKLDFMAKDSIGREWQVATIQLDMNMPERFDLYCINENGEKERIVMIHAAIMGSIERFMSVLIEHTAGQFPFWLAPVQVSILPIKSEHGEYARSINEALKAAGLRTVLDDSNENLGKKVKESKGEKIPYLIVIGDNEAATGKLKIEGRGEEKIENVSIDEVVAFFKKTGEKN